MLAEVFVISTVVLILVLGSAVAVALPLWGLSRLIVWTVNKEGNAPLFVVLLGMVLLLWILIFTVAVLAALT